MAEGTKPYRLYRGGRKKGKVPLQSPARPSTQPSRAPGAPKRRRLWLWAVLGVAGLLVLAVLWGALGFRSFSSGVDKANARLPRKAHAQLAKRLYYAPAVELAQGTQCSGTLSPHHEAHSLPLAEVCQDFELKTWD